MAQGLGNGQILIHPGFHKTGTTWLQREVFTDTRLFNTLLSMEEIDRLIVRPHEFSFQPLIVRSLIARRVIKSGAINVLSSEILVGNPIFGARDATVLARRLKTVIPQARILFTVRRPPQYLRSIYQQYVKRGGSLPPSEFFSPGLEPGYSGFQPEAVQFDKYLQLYGELYGDECVTALPQELLASQPDEFFRLMVTFATDQPPPQGVTISKKRKTSISPPLGSTPLMRFANHFRRTPLHPAGPALLSPFGDFLIRLGYRQHMFSGHYQKQIESAIAGVFKEGFSNINAGVQAYCPVPLIDFGYAFGANGKNPDRRATPRPSVVPALGRGGLQLPPAA